MATRHPEYAVARHPEFKDGAGNFIQEHAFYKDLSRNQLIYTELMHFIWWKAESAGESRPITQDLSASLIPLSNSEAKRCIEAEQDVKVRLWLRTRLETKLYQEALEAGKAGHNLASTGLLPWVPIPKDDYVHYEDL